MNEEIAERVRCFIADEVGVPRAKVIPDTTLFGDLGIDGDEADELMLEFARRFEVDLDGFDFMRHFGPEGFSLRALVVALADRFRGGSAESIRGLQAIPISALTRSAEAGRWIPLSD